MDTNGDKVISLDEFKKAYLNNLEIKKYNEILTKDCNILRKYLGLDGTSYIDFEDYYYNDSLPTKEESRQL